MLFDESIKIDPKRMLYFAALISIVGLVISTVWMRLSEGKWPRTDTQVSVAASLFVTAIVSKLIIDNTKILKQ